MSLLLETKKICQIYNIHPQKSKGQNFLINKEIYDDLIKIAAGEDREILEVGPGLGFLTESLARQAKKLIAVELDDNLVDYLQILKLTNNLTNLQIVNQDILQFNPQKYFSPRTGYYLVANLPYNITSIFLRTFLSQAFPPQSLLLMLQKEVAERIVAQAPKMSLLSLSVQYYAKASIKQIIKADNFWPQPKVDSALIEIDYNSARLNNNIVLTEQLKKDKQLFCLAKIGFRAKRKMLKNNLVAGLKIKEETVRQALVEIGLREDCRAQNLAVSDWQKLSELFLN